MRTTRSLLFCLSTLATHMSIPFGGEITAALLSNVLHCYTPRDMRLQHSMMEWCMRSIFYPYFFLWRRRKREVRASWANHIWLQLSGITSKFFQCRLNKKQTCLLLINDVYEWIVYRASWPVSVFTHDVWIRHMMTVNIRSLFIDAHVIFTIRKWIAIINNWHLLLADERKN